MATERLVYGVVFCAVPGGRLLYSKKFVPDFGVLAPGEAPGSVHPMNIGALVFAIQTYAASTCPGAGPCALKSFEGGNVVICCAAQQDFFVTVLMSPRAGVDVGNVVASKLCAAFDAAVVNRVELRPNPGFSKLISASMSDLFEGFINEYLSCLQRDLETEDGSPAVPGCLVARMAVGSKRGDREKGSESRPPMSCSPSKPASAKKDGVRRPFGFFRFLKASFSAVRQSKPQTPDSRQPFYLHCTSPHLFTSAGGTFSRAVNESSRVTKMALVINERLSTSEWSNNWNVMNVRLDDQVWVAVFSRRFLVASNVKMPRQALASCADHRERLVEFLFSEKVLISLKALEGLSGNVL